VIIRVDISKSLLITIVCWCDRFTMPLTEPDMRFSLIRLFTNTHLRFTTKNIEVMSDFRLW